MEKQISITSSLSILTKGIYEFREGDDSEPLISSIADYVKAYNREFNDEEKENLFLSFEPEFFMTDEEIKQFESLEIDHDLKLLFGVDDYAEVEKKILDEVEKAKELNSMQKDFVTQVIVHSDIRLIEESGVMNLKVMNVDFILSYVEMGLMPRFGVNIYVTLKMDGEIKVFKYLLDSEMVSMDYLELPIIEYELDWQQSEIVNEFAEYINETAGGVKDE